MSCSLQTRICSVLEVLLQAAAAQIGQLLQEDAAAAQMEIRRRNEEIRSLKSRLWSSESRLESLTAARCSVGVQAHITDTGVMARVQETLMLTSPMMNVVSDEKPPISQAPELQLQPLKREDPANQAAPHAEEVEEEEEEEELSGLELQMKIEQVEQLVDQKLGIHDGNSQIWSSEKDFEHHQSLAEPETHAQSFPDPYAMMMEDSGALSALVQENDRNNDCDFNLRHSHGHSSVSDSFSASHPAKTHTQSLQQGEDPRIQTGPKPFRCEECGKSFTQRTRLITHGRVHTGEKPFRCRLCGKMFSRQDNCLRHMRLHSGQSWPAGT